MSAPTISAACTAAAEAVSKVSVTCGLLTGIDPKATLMDQLAAASIASATPAQIACACSAENLPMFTGIVSSCATELKLSASDVAAANAAVTGACPAAGTGTAAAKPAATVAATSKAAPAPASSIKSSAEAALIGFTSIVGALAFL
ncbi:hypothetical protein BJ741DRAFT_574152 [Chytriomyces cf. hyalinus JEL632]|nr:hypothetical protein BJ741DRAFT_574152 [Chytriomyces cf. hyalinus JEL632]